MYVSHLPGSLARLALPQCHILSFVNAPYLVATGRFPIGLTEHRALGVLHRSDTVSLRSASAGTRRLQAVLI